MEELKIKVSRKPKYKTIGTLDWLVEYFNRVEVKIGSTESGIAIFMYDSKVDKQYYVTGLGSETDVDSYLVHTKVIKDYSYTISTVRTKDNYEGDKALFGISLTQAAENLADKFVEACEELLYKELEEETNNFRSFKVNLIENGETI